MSLGSLPLSDAAVVVVAQSGRALAWAAAKAGRAVHIIDQFADRDAASCARSVQRVTLDEKGLSASAVMAALEAVSHRDRVAEVVVGSGLEGQPELLGQINERYRLIGNQAEVVRAVKNPRSFFEQLGRLGIPYPEVRFREPVGIGRWLIKHIGGAGGGHVRPFSPSDHCVPGAFLQRHAEGLGYSVLFLADRRGARVLGYNETWRTHEDASSPYRYAGAMSLSTVPRRLARDLGEAVDAIASAFQLRGLCGLDLILDSDGRWQLLEVNPRPTASFELHGRGWALWEAHVAASSGRFFRTKWTVPERMTVAHRVLYTSHPIRVPDAMRWPGWSRDLPRAGTLVRAGHPLCTITASGLGPNLVRHLISARIAALGQRLGLSERLLYNNNEPLSRGGDETRNRRIQERPFNRA